jgi:colanic acid/amylovoran biosynthesis glycosyltransferase
MTRAATADGRIPLVVYRDHLLRFSEIWVRSQGESLRDFVPYYAGSKWRSDVAMPRERSFVLSNGGTTGRIAEGLFKVAGFAPALRRWMRSIRPALIHAHYGVDGALVAPIARALSVPLVVTFHGYEATMRDAYAARSFYLHRQYLKRRSSLARDGALFIAVSNCVRQALLDQGFPADRTVTHYIGVDAAGFTPDPAVPRENVVLFVGRFDALKGGMHAIRAMAEVEHRIPDATLVIIGDGPERATMEALAGQTLRRCRFLGFQPQAAIKEWLNRARVLCNPSRTIETGECEAFGLVFLEAQAMGVPVVAYASGGVPEAVAHGETGFLVPEGDIPGLAAHISTLLADTALWSRMSAAAQSRVRRDFALDAQTRDLERLYRGVLERHAEARQNGAAAYPKEALPRDISLRPDVGHPT